MNNSVSNASIQRMGGRIRELRKEQGLTLVQLAALTELSHPFLSQVERGLAQPSMGSLHRIAEALGTSQHRLLAAGEDAIAQPVAVLRSDEGVVLSTGEHGGIARQLLVQPGTLYPTEFLAQGTEFGDYFRHEGTEFIYLAEGEIEVELDVQDGERFFRLAARDSLRYPGDVAHRWRCVNGDGARVLMMHTDVQSNPAMP